MLAQNKRKRLTALITAVLPLFPETLRADAVTDWSRTAQTVMVAAALRFPPQTRVLAIMHAAIFDAVNSTERRYSPYAVDFSLPGADARAAAVAAASTVLITLVPSQQAAINAAYGTSLAAIPDGHLKESGIALGQLVAATILSQCISDGSSVNLTYVPGSGPGAWVPTTPTFSPAVFFAWGNITPFVINSSTQFLPNGPPALASDAYTFDFNEVKSLGRIDSAARSADQTNAARFWLENSNFTWNAIARQAVAARQTGLLDNARIFALLNMAAADAIISGFKAKYIYGFWRPITAIHNASTDGNDETIDDTGWQPLAVLPLHPDYWR